MIDFLFRSVLIPNFTFLKTSYPLWFSFWPSFLFVIFPKWVESNSAGLKVFAATSFFYSSSFWFLEVPFICIVSGYSKLSTFLAASLVSEKDISAFRFLCFLAFPLSCLYPVLTVLHVSGILSLWQPLGIPTQLFTLVFLQSFDLGLFSFSSIFSHRL